MFKVITTSVCILIVAILMSMVGRGGGNFYVPILVVAGASMNQAATSAQLILLTTAIVATLVFHKHKTVDWKLALVIDPPTDVMAFVGGYFAHCFTGYYLKILFAGLLVLAAFLMLKPVKEHILHDKKRFGYWNRCFGEYRYSVNLWAAIPFTATVGFFAGMVGISMKIAIGTSSAMVAVTALMGFAGHTIAGDFNVMWTVPMVCAAVVGGLLGGNISIKTNPDRLKKIFAYSTLAAAFFMAFSAYSSG